MIPPCLKLSNIRFISRVKWSNLGKGVAPFPTPRCRSYWKGSLLVALDYGRLLYLLIQGRLLFRQTLYVENLISHTFVNLILKKTKNKQPNKQKPVGTPIFLEFYLKELLYHYLSIEFLNFHSVNQFLAFFIVCLVWRIGKEERKKENKL